MPSCSVFGCKNTSNLPNISFHRFPKDEKLRSFWLVPMCAVDLRAAKWTPDINSSICSEHFEEKFIDRTTNKVKLKPEAIPTIFLTADSNDPLNLNAILDKEGDGEVPSLRVKCRKLEIENKRLRDTLEKKNHKLKIALQSQRRWYARYEQAESVIDNLKSTLKSLAKGTEQNSVIISKTAKKPKLEIMVVGIEDLNNEKS